MKNIEQEENQEKKSINYRETKGIVVEDVYKSFGKEQVLRGVSIRIEPGKVFGVVGNNGCGKTVLMKCICGFIHPDKGRIYVNGERIGKDRDFPKNTGIIIETPGFIPNMSGYANLKLLASLNGKISRQRIKEVLKEVGLGKNMHKKVGKYSLGMRQRLGIAQAIMEDPDVMILDEPFNGLDKNTVVEMREMLKKFKEQGKAILLASHNVVDIEELCDNVLEMEMKRYEE
ncbi:MAG: ABC transporter ATP-binding protein [Lachnospiraceae bacterium]|nr:ABC transporter ATP-binding protein [Lachnospiraceae bacterium]